jgi:integrase
MAGHVQDLWTRPTGEADKRGRQKREPTDRQGIGRRWLATWLDGGRRRTKAFSNKDAAKAWLAQVDVDQRAGTYITPHTLTVAEYGDRWVGSQIHQRASTAEQMESRYRIHIRPALGDVRLVDVTRARVQAAVIRWSETMAATSVAVIYGYLASMMKAACADRLIRDTPCRGINLPRIDHERVVPRSVDEVHAIADAISPRYRGMVLLGAATGMRSGELRGLTVDRLTFDDPLTVRVDRQLVTTAPRFGPPKTPRSDRSITVDSRSAAALREHIAAYPPHASGLIFTGRERGPLARTSAATAWHRALVVAGLQSDDEVERSGWHELRHFHASMLISAGLSVIAVAERLGHQDSAETLRTYAHLWPTDESRARRAVAAGLWPAAGNVIELRA